MVEEWLGEEERSRCTCVFSHQASEGVEGSGGAPAVPDGAGSAGVAEVPAFLLQLLEPVLHHLLIGSLWVNRVGTRVTMAHKHT